MCQCTAILRLFRNDDIISVFRRDCEGRKAGNRASLDL